MIYLKLLVVYLKVGFFGFAGGYAMLPLIQNEVVVRHEWLTNAEFADIVAVSQIMPGPIAINTATYIGYTVTGSVWGSVLAVLAVCMPACTIMLAITRFYMKLRDNRYVGGAMQGVRPVMIGMILAAALLLMTPETFFEWKSWLIFGAAFAASLLKANPILVIVGSAVAGIILY